MLLLVPVAGYAAGEPVVPPSAESPAPAEEVGVTGVAPRRVQVPSTFGSSNIRDWYAPDSRTLIINTYAFGRFKATFTQPCSGIRSTETIGFRTQGPFELDRSTIVVLPDGQRCHIRDLEEYTDEDERRDRAERARRKTEGGDE
jgi:hypothetical protein